MTTSRSEPPSLRDQIDQARERYMAYDAEWELQRDVVVDIARHLCTGEVAAERLVVEVQKLDQIRDHREAARRDHWKLVEQLPPYEYTVTFVDRSGKVVPLR